MENAKKHLPGCKFRDTDGMLACTCAVGKESEAEDVILDEEMPEEALTVHKPAAEGKSELTSFEIAGGGSSPADIEPEDDDIIFDEDFDDEEDFDEDDEFDDEDFEEDEKGE